MSNAVPRRYIQMFSNYDKAFVDKVRTVKFYCQDDSRNDTEYPLPCVFATPQRAFAQIARQIARRKNIDVATINLKTIPLPIASITRIAQGVDLSRYVRYQFNRLQYKPTEDTYVGMNRPKPWDMTYQIDVWARNIGDLDDLSVQMALWMRADEFFLTVDHPEPMGERIVRTDFKGMVENSNVSPNDESERTLRRTWTFVVKGWLCYPAQDAPIVKTIITDIYEYAGDVLSTEFLDRVTITSDDETPPWEEEST